ncbi:MAG: hypothetical protein AB7H90_01420 [Alphaproteobacteria bacterium]
MQFGYGTGALFGERVDVTGSGIGPQQFGVLQNVEITVDFTLRDLYGQHQFPVAIARGQGRITGTIGMARILGRVYSDLFWGETPAAGQFSISEHEIQVIPATPPYTVTVGNAATFNDDLGVFLANNAAAFNRVTTPTVSGDYSVNEVTGVYTFASVDASKQVLISYAYDTASSGRKIVLSNRFQGYTPAWQATFYQPISPGPPGAGGQFLPRSFRLNACVSTRLAMPNTQDAFELHNINFSAFADAAGIIGTFSTRE